MCLIINNPGGKGLHKATIDYALQMNPHGFGFVDLETGHVKRTMDYGVARKLLRAETPFVSHCRYATEGKIARRNCHPFVSPSGRYLVMMNGTIRGFNGVGDDSDTACLVATLDYVKVRDVPKFLNSFTARFLVLDQITGEITMTGTWFQRGAIWLSKAIPDHRPQKDTKGTQRTQKRLFDSAFRKVIREPYPGPADEGVYHGDGMDDDGYPNGRQWTGDIHDGTFRWVH